MPPESEPCIAVVGATGAVGREVLTLLHARGLAPHRVRVLASARSAGTAIPYGDAALTVAELTADSFRGCAAAVFAADAQTARDFGPAAVDAGALVVDNSSAFRLHPEVPLVVPEVNGERVARELARGAGAFRQIPGHTAI